MTLPAPEVSKKVTSQGRPEGFSGVLDGQGSDVDEGFVSQQREVRREAKSRDDLHRGLEQIGRSPAPYVLLDVRVWPQAAA